MRLSNKTIAGCLALTLLFLYAIALPCLGTAVDSNGAAVLFIESPGCTKCAAAERVLEKVGEDIPLNVSGYYYYSDEGHRIIKQYGSKDVPSIIIGSQVIDYRDYEKDDVRLEKLIRSALANQSPPVSPSIGLPGGPENESSRSASALSSPNINLKQISAYSISAVLGAGLVAGFNPCLLGILVFLAASVLSTAGRRRDLILMVAFFSAGIFTMYFLFGLGMQRLLETKAVADTFRYVLTLFLLLAGLSQIWDALRLKQGKPSIFRTDWALPYFQAGVEGGRYRSYFLIGALFSLVKAPCVGAIYLAILDLFSASSYLEGATYLFFFNLGVVLPILLLGGGIALGMSPEQVDSFRKEHRVGMRLATGLALLALSPLIYWQLI
jgi:cytochrome c biogenesis protein CcdA/thiol-disulfide isomerase/thioredoxin